MTYEQTLDYLYAKLPMYQRIGSAAFKKDLTNISELCAALGNPQNSFKSIHVAGTNGKGSTSHILAALYQHNGYRVGLYTSPHLVDFRERIKLNGELCTKEFVVDFSEQIKPEIDRIQPSFFEITVAMAFAYFAEQNVDIAIIETGLGGRLDSTNIIRPLVSVITSIGYDHMDMLGDTLELIAAEKAGIIKQKTPVVLGHISSAPMLVLRENARAKNAPQHAYLSQTYKTDLEGEHQQWNVGCAMKCIELTQQNLPTNPIKNNEALQQVGRITNFVGRWQTLSHKPLIICDVGHNEEGFERIASQLLALNKPIHYLLGFVNDKKLENIIPLLPAAKSYHFVKPNVIRGMLEETAYQKFLEYNIQGQAHPSMLHALKQILTSLSEDEILFVGGSNFVVADILRLIEENTIVLQSN